MLGNLRQLRQDHQPRRGGLVRGIGKLRVQRRVHQVGIDDTGFGQLLPRWSFRRPSPARSMRALPLTHSKLAERIRQLYGLLV